MESFDIDKLFENAAAPIRPPARATCESRRCRGWDPMQYSLGPLTRCNNVAEQHDGTCWAHRDYYQGWWKRHVPNCEYMEDIIMNDNEEEIIFQIENGYVSLDDKELDAALRLNVGRDLFFIWLCRFPEFNYSVYPVNVSVAVRRQTEHVIYRRLSYEDAFADLHRLFDRGYIFTHYLAHVLNWIKNNIQGILGPATIFDALLRNARVTFRDVAGKRQLLATSLEILRNTAFSAEDDDRYNSCKGRFWMWISSLKEAEKATFDPLKEELMAATWAPERLPFWCLDVEEVAEEHPEGLPSKEAWTKICSATAAAEATAV